MGAAERLDIERRPDLLTREQAAAYLGRSVRWLFHHPPDLGGPSLLRVGSRVYYRRADLDRWLDEACFVPSSALPAAAPTSTPIPTTTPDAPPAAVSSSPSLQEPVVASESSSCTSFSTKKAPSGGANSDSRAARPPARRSVDQRANEIEAELRSKRVESARKRSEKQKKQGSHLRIVQD